MDKLCQILYFTENIKKLASDRQFQNLFDLWFNSYVTSFSKLHLDAGVVAGAVITSYYFNVLIIKTLRHHGHYHNSAHTTPSSDTPLGLMVSHHMFASRPHTNGKCSSDFRDNSFIMRAGKLPGHASLSALRCGHNPLFSEKPGKS